MYTLKALRIKNFRLLHDVRLGEAALRSGLYFIGGENEDTLEASSNMAGKSTLLNALTFCLYGCDSVGNDIAASAVSVGKDFADVSCDFVCNATGEKLTIKRTRDVAGSKRMRAGASLNMLGIVRAGVPDVGAAADYQSIIDSIFGPRALFLSAHVFGYGTESFADQNDKTQKRLFDLLINEDVLAAAYTAATAKVQALKVEHAQALETAAKADILITERKAQLHATAQAQQDKRQAIAADIEQAAAAIKKYAGIKATLRSALDELDATIDAHEQKLRVIEEMAASMRVKHAASVDAAKAAHTAAEALYGIATCMQAEKATRCAICQAAYTSSKALDASVLTLGKQVEDALCSLEQARKNAVAANTDCVDAISAERRLLQEVLNEKASKNSAFLGVDRAFSAANATLLTLKQQQKRAINVAVDAQNAAKQAVIDAVKAKKAAEKAAQTLADDLTDYTILRDAFGDKGIRAYKLDKITPVLNRIAAEYSDALFGDGTAMRYHTQSYTKSGQLRERFEAALYKLDSKTQALVKVEVLSAGQAMRRDIIHTLSVSTLAAKLGKRTLDFLAFDELFCTVDAQGIDAVMRVLRSLHSEVKTIWVIEHNEDLRAQFENAIIVTRKGDKSTVSVLR